ncbi:MAG: hypothetical protein K6A89_11025 [Treponema sp.]|nr:hypothetical protein [Treponema sp.]
MDRNKRHSHGNYRNWNDKNRNNKNVNTNPNIPPKVVPRKTYEDFLNKEKAIRDFKQREVICAICGKKIEDMSSALADKNSGNPVHFDCALEAASKNETLKENEKFTYIGQGRFGILSFPDIRDTRHFKIEKIIEWEQPDKTSGWREEISALYSQT